MKRNGRFIIKHLSIDKGTLEQSTQATQTWTSLAAYVLSSFELSLSGYFSHSTRRGFVGLQITA